MQLQDGSTQILVNWASKRLKPQQTKHTHYVPHGGGV